MKFFSSSYEGRISEACMEGLNWLSFNQLSVSSQDMPESVQAIEMAEQAGLEIRYIPKHIQIYRSFESLQ